MNDVEVIGVKLESLAVAAECPNATIRFSSDGIEIHYMTKATLLACESGQNITIPTSEFLKHFEGDKSA